MDEHARRYCFAAIAKDNGDVYNPEALGGGVDKKRQKPKGSLFDDACGTSCVTPEGIFSSCISAHKRWIKSVHREKCEQNVRGMLHVALHVPG